MEMSDIIPVLSINIMGDELHSQSWIFWHVYPGFIVIWELHALKSLELKFGLTSEFSEYLLGSFLMCSFMCLGFLKHL